MNWGIKMPQKRSYTKSGLSSGGVSSMPKFLLMFHRVIYRHVEGGLRSCSPAPSPRNGRGNASEDRRPEAKHVRCSTGLGGKCFVLSFRHTFIVFASACHNPLHRLFAISLRKFSKPGLNGFLPNLTQFFNDYFFEGAE